jgi:competence protein ComEA
MSWKKILSDYFTFSRKDRAGILALICLILIMVLIPFFYGNPKAPALLKADSSLLMAAKPEPGNKIYKSNSYEDRSAFRGLPAEQSPKDSYNKNAPPFPFDPNTLDEKGWEKMGLPAKTIRTIANYRSKGGKFYQREDLKKIWDLPEGFYEHVEAFINIPPTISPVNYPNKEKRETRFTIIDISKADTTAFIALPGIGSKLAARIVNFRDKLGGFHSIDQIGETYGLPDTTFQKIKVYLHCPGNTLQKINLNTATKDELKIHPYIRWNLANAIIEYRTQHGNFNSLEDLKKINLIDESTYNKIIPYLAL